MSISNARSLWNSDNRSKNQGFEGIKGIKGLEDLGVKDLRQLPWKDSRGLGLQLCLCIYLKDTNVFGYVHFGYQLFLTAVAKRRTNKQLRVLLTQNRRLGTACPPVVIIGAGGAGCLGTLSCTIQKKCVQPLGSVRNQCY